MRKLSILILIFTIFLTVPSLFAEAEYSNPATEVGVCHNLEVTATPMLEFVFTNRSVVDVDLILNDQNVADQDVQPLEEYHSIGTAVLLGYTVNFEGISNANCSDYYSNNILKTNLFIIRNIPFNKLE